MPPTLRAEPSTDKQIDLRSTAVVMASEQLGAARLTKFSFNRSMLRRAFTQGWRVERERFEMDADGRGHAAYRVEAEGHVMHFVAFTTTVAEADHTDRVVADKWEIAGALVEAGYAGLTDEFFTRLAVAVPQQEASRLDASVLVLTRGNRSVRFFESLVAALASGQQPSGDAVADAGYIMRSTAFYGNGKFGMKSFDGYDSDHPLAVPYRAQMLAAWLFRELSYDVVEHCAQVRAVANGTSAARFDSAWGRYFGLGNATGLGLVPYAFKHPRVLDAWACVRERALAAVRSTGQDDAIDLIPVLARWIDRAEAHFAALVSDDDRAPWSSPSELTALAARTRAELQHVSSASRPFDELYRWAAADGVETCELVVSLLLELDDTISDDALDRLLRADEQVDIDPSQTVDDLRQLIHLRYAWIDDLDLDAPSARHFWWVVSDNTDEPRRAPRELIEPAHREVAIDVARRVLALRSRLDACSLDDTVGQVLLAHPEHGAAVKRVVGNTTRYGEPIANACDAEFLPLDLQRYQLAMYGMDNFSPKSTDWLRVTLNQGAPRVSDLNSGTPLDDTWAFPARPDALTLDTGSEEDDS